MFIYYLRSRTNQRVFSSSVPAYLNQRVIRHLHQVAIFTLYRHPIDCLNDILTASARHSMPRISWGPLVAIISLSRQFTPAGLNQRVLNFDSLWSLISSVPCSTASIVYTFVVCPEPFTIIIRRWMFFPRFLFLSGFLLKISFTTAIVYTFVAKEISQAANRDTT